MKLHGTLEFHQISLAPGMYLTRGGSVQRPLTSGPGGGQPARFRVGLACGFMHTCLHEKGKAKVVEKVGGN
jgi:hypothetical protein